MGKMPPLTPQKTPTPRPGILIIRKDLDVLEEEHVRRRRLLGAPLSPRA